MILLAQLIDPTCVVVHSLKSIVPMPEEPAVEITYF